MKGENPAARARRKAVETEAAEKDVRAGMEHFCARVEIVGGIRSERIQCDEFYRRGGQAKCHRRFDESLCSPSAPW